MIPDRTLQEIQERLNIVDVIGGYISLRKSGQNFKALCPFHPEKTPSFVVYTDKQFFICYGCGAGGDGITFVMKHEHLEFPEAVEVLAQKAGVMIPQGTGDNSSAAESSLLYRVHESAARFYHELLSQSAEAQVAREYLSKRGLESATWQTFLLGYAPQRWDGLLSYAKAEGYTPQLLERAGLAIRRERGEGWYDRFRGRALFPIWDARGRVIAFGGRLMEEAPEGPKYLNSPETELYVKGKVLYGLHLAVPHIREQDFCIVVEGYMDMVTPYQHGIRNVVASMGTSLTEAQVRLIRRHTRHVVIVYDGDYAGQAATLRGLDLFLEAEMRVKVAVLPNGTDPDSLIRHHGVEAFTGVLRECKELFDYKLGLLTRQFDPRQMEGRIEICQEMLPTIKRVPNAIQRGDYVRRLAEILGISEGLLWTELNRVRLQSSSSWRPAAIADSSAAMQEPAMSAEELLAGLLLEDPSRAEQLEGRLESEDLRDPQVRRLADWMLTRWRSGSGPKDYREFLNDLPRGSGEWENRLARWLAAADTVEEKDRVWEELLDRIHTNLQRASLETLRASIRQAEEAGDEGKTSRLILEYSRLVKSNTASARKT